MGDAIKPYFTVRTPVTPPTTPPFSRTHKVTPHLLLRQHFGQTYGTLWPFAPSVHLRTTLETCPDDVNPGPSIVATLCGAGDALVADAAQRYSGDTAFPGQLTGSVVQR